MKCDRKRKKTNFNLFLAEFGNSKYSISTKFNLFGRNNAKNFNFGIKRDRALGFIASEKSFA